jgi:anti-anti-sigma regulatory factor
MARRQDAVPPSELAPSNWASVANSTPIHVGSRPKGDRTLVNSASAQPRSADDLGPHISLGGSTADRWLPLSLADVGAPRLDATDWPSGSSTVLPVTGALDIAITAQFDDALEAALRRGTHRSTCDLSGMRLSGVAGVTALPIARRRTLACHGLFQLVCSQRLPRKVTTHLGLNAVFHEAYSKVPPTGAGNWSWPARMLGPGGLLNRPPPPRSCGDAVDAQLPHIDRLRPTNTPRTGWHCYSPRRTGGLQRSEIIR